MKIIKIDLDRPDPKAIEQAVEVMLGGGIVVYPTDTCYGIGVDATNQRALHKLAELKLRDPTKPFSIVVRDVDYLKRITLVEPRVEPLLRHYLPGPYTFILLNTDLRVTGHSSLGVRMPDSRTIFALADRMPVPYTTTSANLSGEPPAYSVEAMEATLLNPDILRVVPDLVLDAGPLTKQSPSTIVDLTSWPPKIIREGTSPFDWKKIVAKP